MRFDHADDHDHEDHGLEVAAVLGGRWARKGPPPTIFRSAAAGDDRGRGALTAPIAPGWPDCAERGKAPWVFAHLPQTGTRRTACRLTNWRRDRVQPSALLAFYLQRREGLVNGPGECSATVPLLGRDAVTLRRRDRVPRDSRIVRQGTSPDPAPSTVPRTARTHPHFRARVAATRRPNEPQVARAPRPQRLACAA